MRGQIGGLAQAQRNAQDGISLVQTAEGALTEVHSMLQRVRDLKVQFNNGTNSADDKNAIAAEVAQISQEVGNIVSRDEVQRHRRVRVEHVLVPGRRQRHRDRSAHSPPTSRRHRHVRHGRSGRAHRDVDAALASAGARRTAALSSISTIDNAIKNVSTARANFGAVQNRLEHRLNNLATYQENLTASESRIRDVDMAAEMTKFTKLNILQQAGTSMLAQANQAPQGVLSLLR